MRSPGKIVGGVPVMPKPCPENLRLVCPKCGKVFEGPTARYYLEMHLKMIHDYTI